MEANKETLEEAAEKFAINIQTKAGTMSRENAIEWFKAGAKYQAKRMYSGEEVISILHDYRNNFELYKNLQVLPDMFFNWFEKFKKK